MITKVKMKLIGEFAMDFDGTFPALTLMTGTNGSGKSVVLKMLFALDALRFFREEAAQFIVDNVFDDPNFTGTIEVTFETATPEGMKTAVTGIELDNGFVQRAWVVGEVPDPPMTYMSTRMRLFSEMDSYLKIRSFVTGDPATIVGQMLTSYKLYDVMYMEHLVYKAPIKLDKSRFDDFWMTNVFDQIIIQENKFFGVRDGEVKAMSTLSNGDQALYNMLMQ